MQQKYISRIKLISNKINQSFTYMIDLSLYNSLRYGDLVLVKFNNKMSIGMILEVQKTDEKFNYEVYPVLKVLKKSRISNNSLELLDYLENITFNKKEDIFNMILSKNEVSKNTLEVSLKVDIMELEYKIQNFLKVNKLKNIEEIEKYFQKEVLKYSKVKREHLLLFNYLYEKELIDFNLSKTKLKKVKVFKKIQNESQTQEQSKNDIKKQDYLEKKDYLKKYSLSEYKFNKLRQSGNIKEKEIEEVKLLQDINNTVYTKNLELTDYQQKKLEEIKSSIDQKPVLLRGVTGSGKTSLFIKIIEDVLKENKSVLFLVPEITLAKQIIYKIKDMFGDVCEIYHGNLTSNQKTKIIKRIENKNLKIIIGTRSSAFLNIDNLGLVIVDEEHDASYKQNFYPYYQTLDFVDFWKSKNIKVLLASATPDILSYTKAKKGIYSLVQMNRRYNDYSYANIILKEYDKDNLMDQKFINYIGHSLEKKEKVLIFFNAKGYSKIVECDNCKAVPSCPNCKIPLKYFKDSNNLECSYCDYKKVHNTKCDMCGSKEFNYVGIGIQKVEEELNKYFKGKILRVDAQIAKTKLKIQDILKDFNKSSDKILLGTQIISKGLNFEDLNRVIILNLDNMLYFNDFSAYEQTYQLLEQVSGRSARQQKEGEVIIYTNHKDNFIFKAVSNHSYEEFYKEEMFNRKLQKSVPYYYICQIEIRHKKESEAISIVSNIKQTLENQKLLTTDIMEPYVKKIGDEYRYKVYVKYKRENIKNILEKTIEDLNYQKEDILIDLNITSYGY